MSKWIAEFELEDGDSMPEHMDLNYMGARLDFHCKPVSDCIPIPEDAANGDVIKAVFPNGKIIKTEDGDCGYEIYLDDTYSFCSWFDDLWWNAKYKAESEDKG